MNTIDKITIRRALDTDPDLTFLTEANRYEGCSEEEIAKYEQEDRERLAAYYAGSWSMIGIYVQARILVRTHPNQSGGILQTIRSAGLWGIESDSDNDHLEQTAADELAELKVILTALNVDTESAWPASVAELKTVHE